ncbi:MAG: 2'-5' RNA ligase family protein [Salegentibacter sp.]|uniref:2'-5' RNA ligase n=1 Tax=Salegentibacter flavus TaxID=287099 RepID=A0A1I5BBS2_9FLAO|nr:MULTISPECIES: 2'-5' RNA ligase family protein [Salegentibacter]MDR9457282.1 2'-5' RNA ligase family protein [Salegentibacter sp.]SFN71989.1 2'-5' RNA ligase [Salegentibacter flavus]
MSLYFIAILPPEALSNRIKKLKLELAENYQARRALKLPAHITLQIPFRMSKTREEKLHKILRDFAENQEPFEIKTAGFGRFSRKVLFIAIAENPEMVQLHQKLQKSLDKNLRLKENEKGNNFHPHFTLATRDLSIKNFEPAWKELKDRGFKASFTAESLVLFKHNGKTWDCFGEFFFNKPSTTTSN